MTLDGSGAAALRLAETLMLSVFPNPSKPGSYGSFTTGVSSLKQECKPLAPHIGTEKQILSIRTWHLETFGEFNTALYNDVAMD
jgi:hypothetical protein